MIGKAKLSYIRMSPRKVRQVIDLIRGKNCVRAMAQLGNSRRRAAVHVHKLLLSALRNVENKSGYKPDALFVSKITADKGPHLKRFRARAMGRAAPILKRMSHIQIELGLVPGAKVVQEPVKPAGGLKAIGRRLKRKTAAG